MTEMTESLALDTWSTPNCPFTIEYSRRLLDDIRLAVVDAFFSLPRGGAEIGGVLLGKFANGRLTILEYMPLECEHIFGPSFTLSPADHNRLTEILSTASTQYNDLEPVGWYHSHTRSDIFLSEADLDIHNRYFREPFQVALVLRPSTFQPVQAGFFFREPDGSMHIRGSYQEFALDPLPVGQVPRGMPAPPPQPIQRMPEPEGPTITLTAAPVPTPVEAQQAPQAFTAAASVSAAEPVFVPAEPPPAPRNVLLPPALPPLPRLELVPEPGERNEAPVAEHRAAVAEDPAEADIRPGFIPFAPSAMIVGTAPKAEVPPAASIEPETPVRVEPELPIAGANFAPAEEPVAPSPAIEPAPDADIKAAPPAEIQQIPQPEAQPQPAHSEPPTFLQVEPVRSRRKLWVVGAAAVIVVLAAGGYQQRASLLSPLKQRAAAPTPAPVPAPVPLTLPLSARDQQGQLQIQWDGAARAVAQARDGILQITDDGATTDLPMDAAHLQSGEFTYARRGEHVDARLTIQELDGTQVRTVTSFYGALPTPVKPAVADPALRKQNAELASKNADLTMKNAALGSKNTDLAKMSHELQLRMDELGKQTAKLKSDLVAQAATSKRNAELTRQNADLAGKNTDLAKQTAKLKADLAARAASPKQSAVPAPANQGPNNAQLVQQRDDLLIQIAKLKADLATTGKQNPNPQLNADFSKQRYQLVNRVSQLESDLAVETTRAERLARQLEDLKKQQTQRRLQNQSGEPTQ
jgi:proteasome lid subunit RPN8/RPN11